jgi:hypothetical protein
MRTDLYADVKESMVIWIDRLALRILNPPLTGELERSPRVAWEERPITEEAGK